MADEQLRNSPHRARVSTAILNQFHGKPVCFLGTVLKADGGGTAFQMKGCDGGGPVNIRLKSPITEPLSGLVEVYGVGQGKNLIIADSFYQVPDSVSNNFDMNAYSETIKLLHTVEQNSWMPAAS